MSAFHGALAGLKPCATSDPPALPDAPDLSDPADHPVLTDRPFASYRTSRLAMPADTPRNSSAAATCAHAGTLRHQGRLLTADCSFGCRLISGGAQCASCARTPRSAATSAWQRAHVG